MAKMADPVEVRLLELVARLVRLELGQQIKDLTEAADTLLQIIMELVVAEEPVRLV
jgi:hypothetical protein